MPAVAKEFVGARATKNIIAIAEKRTLIQFFILRISVLNLEFSDIHAANPTRLPLHGNVRLGSIAASRTLTKLSF
jgi:hypothetical protein